MRGVSFTSVRIEIVTGRSCSKIRRGATDRGSAGFELHLSPQEVQQLGQSYGAYVEQKYGVDWWAIMLN